MGNYLEEKIFKLKLELIHSGYLSGWEIYHYKKLLKELEERLKYLKMSYIPTQNQK